MEIWETAMYRSLPVFDTVHGKTSGDAASDRRFDWTDDCHFHPAWRACGGKTESDDRLPDSVLQLYGKQYAQFFRGTAFDAVLCDSPEVVSGYFGRSQSAKRGTACTDPCDRHVCQVSAAGKGNCLDELGQSYVTGAKARGIPFSTTLVKSIPRFACDDSYSAYAVHRKPSWRNSDCRIYFYVGRSWKTCGGCYLYA